jgi:hypothetical protein
VRSQGIIMAFKDIHKLKKIAVVEKEIITVSYLVVGKDIFSLSLYADLKNAHGNENVRLLSEDAILKSDLLPKGPSTIRGETNQKIFKHLYPDVTITKCNENSLFYKDMVWKSFGGRSKPEMLKYDEGFFTGERIDPNYEEIFKNVSHSQEQIDSLNIEAYQVRIKSINRNETGFIVECINGTEFHCENLYFGLSPYYYLQYYSDKNHLSVPFIEFCESTKTSSALFVKFVFDETPLSDMKETLFIPLSYTHDWGHFIGEFKQVENHQEIEFMHFLEDQLMSEEDVSRVIRLLKKSMEKIFDKFNKIKSHEYIALEQEIGCLKIDDHGFEKSLELNVSETQNLFFIGINAPITSTQCVDLNFEYSPETLNGVVRALFIHHNHTKKFD